MPHFATAAPELAQRGITSMSRVLVLEHDRGSLAIQERVFTTTPVLHLTIDQQPLVVWWSPGVRSALDRRRIDRSKPIGSVGVFYARMHGQPLSFRAVGPGRFTDHQTNSTWDHTGACVAGDLTGSRLERRQHVRPFAFAVPLHFPGATWYQP
jgi:hypothetical protein